MNDKHRPWCGECKTTMDQDKLNIDGYCARCVRIREVRARAAARRAEEAPVLLPNKKARVSRASISTPATPEGIRYDRAEIVRMYQEDELTSRQIADKLDTTKRTIVNHLTLAGVWDPTKEGRGGRPKADFCANGHLQSTYRKESAPGRGDWHCGACKLKRNKLYIQNKAARTRDNRLVLSDSDTHELVLGGELVGTITASAEVAKALDERLRWLSTPAVARRMLGGSARRPAGDDK